MAEKLLFQILVPSIFLELILTLTSSPIYILVVAWSVLTVVAYRYFYINRFKANSFAMNWNSAIQQAQNQQQHVLHFFRCLLKFLISRK
ncbi:hypothetical protein [Leuconostoc litchii]|uniref:hypothetical protein n=1 Tax=Leuconostoc litchii TaxID=1981069 RepID=UPI0024E11E72|nr:hypothetical protein [Leuconostoc litchii]